MTSSPPLLIPQYTSSVPILVLLTVFVYFINRSPVQANLSTPSTHHSLPGDRAGTYAQTNVSKAALQLGWIPKLSQKHSSYQWKTFYSHAAVRSKASKNFWVDPGEGGIAPRQFSY